MKNYIDLNSKVGVIYYWGPVCINPPVRPTYLLKDVLKDTEVRIYKDGYTFPVKHDGNGWYEAKQDRKYLKSGTAISGVCALEIVDVDGDNNLVLNDYEELEWYDDDTGDVSAVFYDYFAKKYYIQLGELK